MVTEISCNLSEQQVELPREKPPSWKPLLSITIHRVHLAHGNIMVFEVGVKFFSEGT